MKQRFAAENFSSSRPITETVAPAGANGSGRLLPCRLTPVKRIINLFGCVERARRDRGEVGADGLERSGRLRLHQRAPQCRPCQSQRTDAAVGWTTCSSSAFGEVVYLKGYANGREAGVAIGECSPNERRLHQASAIASRAVWRERARPKGRGPVHNAAALTRRNSGRHDTWRLDKGENRQTDS